MVHLHYYRAHGFTDSAEIPIGALSPLAAALVAFIQKAMLLASGKEG